MTMAPADQRTELERLNTPAPLILHLKPDPEMARLMEIEQRLRQLLTAPPPTTMDGYILDLAELARFAGIAWQPPNRVAARLELTLTEIGNLRADIDRLEADHEAQHRADRAEIHELRDRVNQLQTEAKLRAMLSRGHPEAREAAENRI